MVELPTAGDRTFFFDLLPIAGATPLHGKQLRFQLATVPGQLYYERSRLTVMRHADGVVFVADSMPSRLDASIEAMYDLTRQMQELDLPADIPLVIQYNKRDVPGALDLDLLEEHLNYRGVPQFQSVASEGVGVIETLAEVLQQVEGRLRAGT
jgi:signal recognition particle receptor subunit beta